MITDDRLVTVTLPGTAWLTLFLGHFEWAIEADELDAEERLVVARQLLVLHEAVTQGAPACLDDVVTEQRELLELALDRLGYTPSPIDARIAKAAVYRAADVRSLLRKLATAAAS